MTTMRTMDARWVGLLLVVGVGVLGLCRAAVESSPRSMRIAVVGAGASGLTAAHTLRERGYSNVTVYEKEGHAGGKVHSVEYQGNTYEFGAFWALSHYRVVLSLAQRYGVEFQPEPLTTWMHLKDGASHRVGGFTWSSSSGLELLQNLRQFMHVQTTFGFLLEPNGLFHAHPDLRLPFDAFARKHQIESLARLYRPFWIACGYGYYERTPAMYVVKQMLASAPPQLSSVVSNLQFLTTSKAAFLFRAPQGFQEVWKRVAADLPDVRFNTPVERVHRRLEAGRNVVDVTAGGRTDTFDAVVVSTDLGVARTFMDLDAYEDGLFAQVRTQRYAALLFTADVPYPPDSLVMLDHNSVSSTMGHPMVLMNRAGQPGLWQAGSLIPPGISHEEVVALLREDVGAMGGTVREIIKIKEWDYFPHVSSEALREGFYYRLQSLQGLKGTYYVGGIMNFETVESTAAYARWLVEQYFP